MNKKTVSPQRAGLLQRLVRFVRHPATDWAATQIDPALQRDAAREKARQREMRRLERAAQMIRDEEFEFLRREMRNRKVQSAAALEGLTLPPTLQPPQPPASRLHTLHKIDAIERQIQNEQRALTAPQPAAALYAQSGLARVGFGASTLRAGSRRAATPRWSYTQPLGASRPQTTLPAASTQPPALGHTVLPTPAAIELAAFDFADGRDAQVESQLLTSLQTEPDAHTVEWIFQALLDFYWATAQHDKLQARTLDYVQRYGRTPLPRPEFTAAQHTAQTASFMAAEHFDALQLRAFERFVAEPSAHLVLDWSGLIDVPEAQHAALAQALRQLNERSVELELHGADQLLAATRLQSRPAAEAHAALFLQVLRLLDDEAGFVDLAVELSVERGCSPVDWEPPRFTRRGSPHTPATTQHRVHASLLALSSTHAIDPPAIQTTARLGGDLRGGDESFLRGLRAQSLRSDAITVELDAVRRMDFAAATALLNWVEAQAQLGKTVELRGAHTLLAPFLRSVGLTVQT